MTDAELTPKEVGGFRILRRLASGATSDVLLARAEGPHGFKRVVALKILLSRKQGNPEFEKHFAAEASAYARLTSPAVVKLYDFFSADGQLVLVLEFVDGLPLHKLRAMLAIAGERVEDKAALYLGMRIFTALAAAHGARDPGTGVFAPVAHYDVNPSNILIPWDGQVKLGDFGIARAAGVENDARAGFVKGTYGYSAPEQVSGKEPSLRADIYSAGLILWELLARRKAVQRGNLNDAQVLRAMAHPEFPALELLRPDLAAPVRAAVRRTLEPDPEKRTITADEVVAILRAAFVADDGRAALATALMRVRNAGGSSDPLASTTPLSATAARAVYAKANAEASDEKLDPEQTAPFSAVNDESGDLGNIAFRGRIKLPNTIPPDDRAITAPVTAASEAVTSPPPAVAVTAPPPAASAAPPPPPLPASAPPDFGTTLKVAGAPPLPAATPALPDLDATPLPPSVGPSLSPHTLLEFPPRPIPRPAGEKAAGEKAPEKKISNYPTVPAPPLEAEVEAISAPPTPAAGTPPTLVAKVDAPPAFPPLPPIEAVPAPVTPPVVPVAEPSAPGGPPRTERSPETADLPADPKPQGSRSSPPASQALKAPYVQSELPPKPPSRFPWAAVVVVGLLLAGGGMYLVRGGDSDSAMAPASSATAPHASALPTPPPPASVAASTPSAAVSVAATASAAPSASAAPLVSTVSTAPSASSAPSATVAAIPSVASVPSAATPAAPPPESSAPIAADMGEVELPSSAAGHRVFVDGKVAQEGAAPMRVHCGSHDIKVGSAGAEREVKVPCGGTVKL